MFHRRVRAAIQDVEWSWQLRSTQEMVGPDTASASPAVPTPVGLPVGEVVGGAKILQMNPLGLVMRGTEAEGRFPIPGFGEPNPTINGWYARAMEVNRFQGAGTGGWTIPYIKGQDNSSSSSSEGSQGETSCESSVESDSGPEGSLGPSESAADCSTPRCRWTNSTGYRCG
jgi:hypothetical protein